MTIIAGSVYEFLPTGKQYRVVSVAGRNCQVVDDSGVQYAVLTSLMVSYRYIGKEFTKQQNCC